MIAEDLTALEALGVAIRSEIDAQEVYKDLASMTDNDILKERFMNLYHEEKRHQMLLEKKYNEMFPDVELKLPPSHLPKEVKTSRARKKMEIKDVLQLAIDEERRSREYYLDCAETAKDLSGSRMFRFLADMEFSHQMMLTAELELIDKYPAYFEEDIKSWEAETGLKKEILKHH